MSIFFKDKKKEWRGTLTKSRSFLGVMVDPEVDSYFIIQSKISNSTKSEKVREKLQKIYNDNIMDAIRNMVRKILISINSSTINREEICKELKHQGIHKNHVEQITELLWKELEKNQNH